MKRLSAFLSLILILQIGCGLPKPGPKRSGSGQPTQHFKPGFNLFKPEQDIELGRQSAQQIAQQMPMLNDETTVNYVRQLGAKLTAKAPGYKFPYQFNVVATKDINAFALPGGYIFVNAGAIMAAKNEGELAGVISHEISHVALRHGTNQATKAYIAKAGLGIISVIAGSGDQDAGAIINVLGGAGANMLFLKFGRAAETQSDLEGARIMAEAGYDPRDMAGFFQTLQKQGQRTPEFLSDHPDPGNRVQSINDLLPSLSLSPNPIHNTPEFEQVKARLTGNSAIKSSADLSRRGPSDPTSNKPGARPQPPSGSMQQYQAEDGSFALQFPDNWDGLTSGDKSNLIFAPKGAYGKLNDSLVVTHGIFIGVTAPQSSDLDSANATFVQQQLQANPDFRMTRSPQPVNFNGRTGYATIVSGSSPVTGVVEIDVIYTTTTADGQLFYLITIAPQDELQSYQATFEKIISTLQVR